MAVGVELHRDAERESDVGCLGLLKRERAWFLIPGSVESQDVSVWVICDLSAAGKVRGHLDRDVIRLPLASLVDCGFFPSVDTSDAISLRGVSATC